MDGTENAEGRAADAEARHLSLFFPDLGAGLLPSEGYSKGLGISIFRDLPELFMSVLNTSDMPPWEIKCSEDKACVESSELIDLLELARRNKAWGCVEAMVKHWSACRRAETLLTGLDAAYVEYEGCAADDERRKDLEAFFFAANRGFAANLQDLNELSLVNFPTFPANAERSARCVLSHFAKLVFLGKGAPPVLVKRLALRQAVIGAVATGSIEKLALGLEGLNANAAAFRAVKRVEHPPVTAAEMEAFVSVCMACGQPACSDLLLAKIMEFDRCRKGHEASTRQAMANKVLTFARAIEGQPSPSRGDLDAQIARAVEREIAAIFTSSSAMADGEDDYEGMIQHVREQFDYMLPCLVKAFRGVQSVRERRLLKAAAGGDTPNAYAVLAPSERARL